MKNILRWIATPFAALLVACMACCSRYGDGKSFYATPHTNAQGTIQYNVIHSTAECASSSEDGKKGGYRIVHDCYSRDYFCPKCMNDSLIYIIKHPEVPDSDSVVDDEEYEEYSYIDEETDRIKGVYNALIKEGYTDKDLGGYEKFSKAMRDGKNDAVRRNTYSFLKNRGYSNLGDYETFSSKILEDNEETKRINGNRKWIYDALTKRGDNLGSYEQFDKAMSDGNNRKWVYERAQKHGLKVGDYDTYENAIYNRKQ